MNEHLNAPAPRQPLDHEAHRVRRRRLVVPTSLLAATLVFATFVAGPTAGAATRNGNDRSTTAEREDLGDTEPENAPGQTLYLQKVTIPPGQALDEHFHAGTQVARVLKGVLTYEVVSGTVEITRRNGRTESVTGPATVKVRAGESLVETASLAHAARNDGKRPVVIELAALLATGATLASPVGSETPGTQLQLSADLVSQETHLYDVGPDDSVTYGWNRLTGTADADGPVEVELLGNVAYHGGVGPFFGFITFTFADGSRLATQVQGNATKDSAGVTHFASTLGVLGGTGRYADAVGTGTFIGSREAALGQPVRATFAITVDTKR